ncbi:hypothetical protein ACVIGB_008972 [Bradyrhizobium sp. USDA 4341]
MIMRELRDLVIDAHGGIERWNNVKAIEGDMSISGGLWTRKGWPVALKNVRVTAAAGKQWISYHPFLGEGMRSSWTPDHTVIETLDGKSVKDRKNPRAAFDGHTVETRWDELHLAYFSGYAMWNYLNTPFIFALPGFRAEEIEPWDENGETRRRLKVTFPDHIATHCAEQVFHVNGEGLICRMDYSAAVAGGVPTAHYLDDHRDFSGIKVATKRRAVRRNADGTAIPDPVFVAIDIADVRFS